jgi:SOS-response transcriptional repressor LexA
MPRSRSSTATDPQFRQQVLTSCLAQKIVSGGYSPDSYQMALAADLRLWSEIAEAASAALAKGRSKRRAKR